MLSYDGLVPAALMGVDLTKLLAAAVSAASSCEPSVEPKENPGAWLGAILGELEKKGRDKMTFVISPRDRGLRELGRAADCGEHWKGGEGDTSGSGSATRAPGSVWQ